VIDYVLDTQRENVIEQTEIEGQAYRNNDNDRRENNSLLSGRPRHMLQFTTSLFEIVSKCHKEKVIKNRPGGLWLYNTLERFFVK
jgi:hypothetical protein